MSRLKIPMNPADLPQQRLYGVKELPPLPNACEIQLLDYVEDHGLLGIPKKPTKKSIFLGQVEWAWGPMHNRVSAYEIHKGKKHWLLWCGGTGDDSDTYITNWYASAFMPIQGVSEKQAATYLLLAFWRSEADSLSLDKYHWINVAGALSVSDLQAIASLVWPDDEGEESK